MSERVGWHSVFRDIIDAGVAARKAEPFDANARSREVARQLSEVSSPSWLLVILAIALLAVPKFGIWFSALFLLVWSVGRWRSAKTRAALDESLAKETQRLQRAAEEDATAVAQLLRQAQGGDGRALNQLLVRWSERRPPEIQTFTARLNDRGHGWQILCSAIGRDNIPAHTSRSGRGGRPVFDKRKATEVDEDLVELNAAATLSLLIALFDAPETADVAVRVDLNTQGEGGIIPWIVLETKVSSHLLESALGNAATPSDAIRALGGGVGRCRAHRYKAAELSTGLPATTAKVVTKAGQPSTPETPSVISRALAAAALPSAGLRDAIAVAAAPITPAPINQSSPPPALASRIPPAPASLVVGTHLQASAPSAKSVQGPFATVALKFVDYSGDPSARFVAFQSYWPQYSSMAPGQLKFYFKWRNEVRSGKTPRTDLSYIFVLVYELLHYIGAQGPADAAAKLESLWVGYRSQFPQLDRYLVSWISDVYATDLGLDRAHEFLQRAASIGAALRDQESLLLADQYWAKADYLGMSNPLLEVLVRDPRLSDNKFYVAHNSGPAGTGWIDRAYRDALLVADKVFRDSERATPRERELERFGRVEVSRESFAGAVYGWNRRPVRLGHVPRLAEDGLAVPLYRNAMRYAENILRAERSFGAKRRGVEVSKALGAALDGHFQSYLRSTRPKARVVIDLSRARALEQESAEIRSRLLEGLDSSVTEVETPSGASTMSPAAKVAPQHPAPPLPVSQGDGLLTDLEAVQSALNAASPSALDVLRALADDGWEAPANSVALSVAAKGALVSPLVDEINEHVLERVKDVLIVHEDGRLVVQEDFRDEVYWVLRGTLDGYLPSVPAAEAGTSRPHAAAAEFVEPDTDGFEILELEALQLLASADASTRDRLAQLAADNSTTLLLLVDRLNEKGLSSPFGDLLVEMDSNDPGLFDDAAGYVTSLLERTEALRVSAAQSPQDFNDSE